MRWPWIREARLIELQTAKEILAEVFHARPGEVEEMIKTGWRRGAGPKKRRPGRRSARWGCGRRRSAWGNRCGAEI